MEMRMDVINAIKNIINEYYEQADCGIYRTRNTALDPMHTIYRDVQNGVTVDICYTWRYFEVFGLDRFEWDEIRNYYRNYDL